MSMNLCFYVSGGGFVDFPFQTPTELTYKVFQASTTDARIEILRETLREWGWGCEDIKDALQEIKDLLNNPNLDLQII